MARTGTGKAPNTRGRSATAPPAGKPKSKAPSSTKKNVPAKPQVKADPAKKPAARAKTTAAKLPIAAGRQAGAAKKSAVQTKAKSSPAKAATVGKTLARTQPPPSARASGKKAPVTTSGVPRAAQSAKAPTKTVSAPTSAPRRPTTRAPLTTPATRRARLAAPPRKPAVQKPATQKAPVQRTAATQTQSFIVSHLDQNDFKADGLRTYALYRDLGIAAATSGLCQAHVIRFVPPCTEQVRKRHLHKADLQLVYVLQGWMKNEFEGHGEQMMSAGSCWIQPSGIKHTVLDYSADCEVLEIVIPADFATQELT
jgi:uncharacterized RmlC-like cupin family protein